MSAMADPTPTPFASHAGRYHAAGWAGVLPIPPRRKSSPPSGFTGDSGAYPTAVELDAWVADGPACNLALRMNADTIGIDVDNYDGKPGGQTLESLIAECGPLPPTWVSTSRTDGVSGIRFYRLTEPTKLIGALPGIEIIQRHHRYAVVAPSLHPDGRQYRWISPDGEIGDHVPNVVDLPELPATWLAKLRADTTTSLTRRTLATGHFVAPAVDRAYGQAVRGLGEGTRHDSALAGATTLVRLDSLGFPGAADTLERLRHDFLRAVGDSRTASEAEKEWQRIIDGAEKVVASTPSTIQRWDDQAPGGTNVVEVAGEQLAGAIDPATPWPEPIPLGANSELPSFPAHVLPDWITDHADEVAMEIQVPIDLPATLAIGALSTIATGKIKVAVWGRWTEHANLFLVVAMPPSTGKSPAYKAMCSPVIELEQEYGRMVRAELAANQDVIDLLEGELKKAKQNDNADLAVLASIRQRLFDAQEKPTVPPKFTVGDATPEVLAKLIADNGGRMAVHSTEGGVFGLMAGRYSERANLDIYLQAWSGDRLDTMRIGRGGNEAAEALLTMVLTVQPDVIRALADNPELAGRGLTARFMYSMPPDTLGERDLGFHARPDTGVGDTYREKMLALGRRFLSWQRPAVLRLDEAAATHYSDWRQAMERRRRPDGDLRPMAEWTGKLESSVLRLAGLLHMAHDHHPEASVSVDTVAKAITVGEYWLAHAAHVHDLWGTSPVVGDARKILTWMQARPDPQAPFTPRDLYADRRRDFPTKESTVAPLELLVERGWCRVTEGNLHTSARGKSGAQITPRPDLSTEVARHARHVLRKTNQSLSLSIERDRGGDTSAHGAHGAQLAGSKDHERSAPHADGYEPGALFDRPGVLPPEPAS